MLKKLFFPLSIFSIVFLSSCDKYEKTESGIRYKILVDSAGPTAKYGDDVIVHVKYENEIDTLNTFKRGMPVMIKMDTLFPGGIEEALKFASVGDSLLVKVLNDSLYKPGGFAVPDSIKSKITESYTTFAMKVVDIKTPAEQAALQNENRKRQIAGGVLNYQFVLKYILDSFSVQIKKDEQKINEYLMKKKMKAERTNSSVYYVVTKEGTGPQPQIGDSVSVSYIGKLLNDQEFDRSQPENPLTFQMGIAPMSPGFVEGILQLKEGSKAIVIMPSSLAYGSEGVKKRENDKEYAIPPDSPLAFEIEVLKVYPQAK